MPWILGVEVVEELDRLAPACLFLRRLGRGLRRSIQGGDHFQDRRLALADGQQRVVGIALPRRQVAVQLIRGRCVLRGKRPERREHDQGRGNSSRTRGKLHGTLTLWNRSSSEDYTADARRGGQA